MAGGKPKYRHLSRKSSHRQALLRNLVTSLFQHESIHTTWPKAKEAQRLAEKLITLGKRNTNASRIRAQQIFYTPHALLPKLFGPLRERYALRPGGYTRVLRTESKKDDGAPSAILELVDGPKDMRFAMTAQVLAAQSKGRKNEEGSGGTEEPGLMPGTSGGDGVEDVSAMNKLTLQNVKKVTRFREGGEGELRAMVERLREMGIDKDGNKEPTEQANVR
ncbi:MAG: hypothetical protein M1837_004709 [Sclerophora amabilis]|nr:MAG: hypothetical protein M1837_004709 [Sclerophora amabilis]